MEAVIILNQDYQFLNKVSWQKAICLVYKGKAEVLRHTKKVIRNAEHTVEMLVPKVLRLLKLVRAVYKQKVPFSRKNIMVRDDFVCQYCGVIGERLTIDHVIPKSRGGKTNFENCVGACKTCNAKKANKTPREAKMFLRKQPYSPTIMEFLRMQMKKENIDTFLEELGVY